MGKSFPALQVAAYLEDTGSAHETFERDAPSYNCPVSESLFGHLAQVTNAVGTDHFLERTAHCLAEMLDCERYLVVRYSRYSKPEFLVNNAMNHAALEGYLKNLYRIDPLLRMVREDAVQQLLTFEQLKKSATDTLFYDEIFRTASILDEMIFMFPTVGGIWTAICVDRSETLFSERDIAVAASVFPLIEQLHALHADRCVFGWNGGYLDDSRIAFMMADAGNRTAFRNTLWSERVPISMENTIRAISANRTHGNEPVGDGRVVHWEPLNLHNPVAPGGRAYLIEEISPGYLDLAAGDMIDAFARAHGLTPREKQIISHILQGEPPALIADTMGLSVGTIRNHKHRLYYKLDITTERELFCMFFEMMIAKK